MSVKHLQCLISRRHLAWGMCGLLLASLIFMAPQALAQAVTNPVTTSSSQSACADYPGLTNKIAACVRNSLDNATERYFEDFYGLVATAITAFLTIGVAIYGAMAAAGMVEKIGRDTVMLIIKIAAIAFFTTNVPLMYDTTLNLMDASANAVLSYVPSDGAADQQKDFSQITCLQNMQEAVGNSSDPEHSSIAVWMGMDCVLDSVIGIKTDGSVASGFNADKWFNDKLDDRGLSRGLIYLFFSSMQTSVVGLILAIIGFIFLYGLVVLVARALFTYLLGYIGVGFLMIISPLFIPLVLFRSTKNYFDKWARLVLGFALQPVLIIVFVSLSIAAIDLAMFSGDYSVMYKVAGEESRKPGFNLNKYLTETHEAVKATPRLLADLKASRESGSTEAVVRDSMASGARAFSECAKKRLKGETLPEECDAYGIKVWTDSIDWEKLAAARQNPPVVMEEGVEKMGQQIAREVLSAAIFAGIVVFIMNGLLAIVPHIVNDLVGDAFQSPNLYAVGRLPGQDQAAQVATGASGGLRNMLGNMTSGRTGGG